MNPRERSAEAEEAGINAWPALDQVLLDGWLLRFADGLSRRANSVNPLAPGRLALPEKIALCEARYRARRLPTIFRLAHDRAPDLEALLTARGYRPEGETRVLHADLADPRGAPDSSVELSEAAGPDWLAALGDLQAQDERQRLVCRRILDLLAIPATFAAIRRGGAIAALAYAARHDRMASVNSVATAPPHRRQGLARRTIGALLDGARAGGATGACVQVAVDNRAAIALYEALGFDRELYRYRYWREPAD